MKSGRRIYISHPMLVNLRKNLRKLLLEIVRDSHENSINYDIFQSSLGHSDGWQKRKEKIETLYDLSFISICKCHDCHTKDKDAVFWSMEVYEDFCFPPRIGNDRDTRKFWLCPECYEKKSKRIEELRAKRFIFLWIWGTNVSLEEQGFKDIHEYLNLPETVCEVKMNDPEDLTEWERNYYKI